MTIAVALRDAAVALGTISDTARLDAELLMAHALGVSRSDLLLRHVRDAVPAGFAPLLARRLRAEPVAYILGEQEFYGRSFIVTPDVLIPRGDSETIVEAALDARPDPARVLDCGTGSGALLLTVLAERAKAQGVGIDRSPGALAMAQANAGRLGLGERVRFVRADWHVDGWAQDLGRFDLILANPPYVEEDARLHDSVRAFEPAEALFAGPEGLNDYRALVPQLPQILCENGVAVLEIGATQAQAVEKIAAASGFCVQCQHDLAGRPRAMILTLGLGKPGSSG